MKIALAQLNYHIGDFKANTQKIISSIRKAQESGAELAVFAELAVTGYPPRDFLEFDDFILKSEASILEIAAVCHGIAAIIGAPSRNFTGKGKPLFNSAWFLSDGKVQKLIHKSLL
ncbi:MAG: NAD+ synthase, partial [Lentimicrobium sp.]|nr:NAD+ synthase [Lentimicrobium sp.]